MKRVAQYIFAVVISIFVIFLKFSYPGTLGANAPFLLLIFSVVVSTRIGGFFPGLLSLITTAFLAWYFFIPSQDSLQISSPNIIQLIGYLCEGFIILLLVARLKKSKSEEHLLREQFEIILASIGDAVIGADKEGKIMYMNSMAQNLTGWTLKEAKGKQTQEVMNIIHERTRDAIENPVKTTLDAGKNITLSEHMILVQKDGTEINIEDSAAPIRNAKGEIIGIVIVFRDVTERKQLEEHRELIIGVASHELKNNIAGMQGYTQLLQRVSGDFKSPKAEQYTDKLNRKIGILNSIISGMLDVTRMKVGTIEMANAAFSVTDLIHEVTADSEVILKDHILKIKGDVSELVRGDKIRISQVITNLLSNAAKYSPHKSDIIVSFSADKEKVTVGIQDFGMGIPTDRQENIFKPFYRAVGNVDKANISGSGLGLYISYEIVKQNGGNMWVESKEGNGSTFYFTIPLAHPIIEEMPVETQTVTLKDRIKNFFDKFSFR